MPEDVSQLTCDQFQRRLCELLASDQPIEEHPHYKACILCRYLVRGFEEMIERTLGEQLDPKDGQEPKRKDDWPEAT